MADCCAASRSLSSPSSAAWGAWGCSLGCSLGCVGLQPGTRGVAAWATAWGAGWDAWGCRLGCMGLQPKQPEQRRLRRAICVALLAALLRTGALALAAWLGLGL